MKYNNIQNNKKKNEKFKKIGNQTKKKNLC